MTGLPCPEDLLVRERRGQLEAEERLALETHASACESCRMSRFIGGVIEPLPATPAAREDSELVARLVAAALTSPPMSRQQRRGSRIVRPWRSRRLAVAAAILLLAGSAGAMTWRWSRRPDARARSESAAVRSPARGGGASSRRSSVPVPVLPAAAEQPELAPPPGESAPAAERPPREAVRPPHASGIERAPGDTPRSTHGPTASELFTAAGAARRARAMADTVRLYRELQARFPESPEAQLSFLSLGDLFASSGRHAEALTQFDRYLGGQDGAMAEEALIGRARALRGLGRIGEEMSTWRELLDRFPASDYRWRAQQRLAEPR